MPPRLLDERALAPLPPPNALDDREDEDREDEPPKSRLELPAELRFDEPPMSRVPELGRLEEPPRSRVPALAFPALRDPGESRVPTWLPAMSR